MGKVRVLVIEKLGLGGTGLMGIRIRVGLDPASGEEL